MYHIPNGFWFASIPFQVGAGIIQEAAVAAVYCMLCSELSSGMFSEFVLYSCACRSEYIIFQKILKLEYEFPDGFAPLARSIVEKLLVSKHILISESNLDLSCVVILV